MELDQFMKELIVEFLVEVVRLFFPPLEQRLDFAQGVRVFLYEPEQLQREEPELFLLVRDKILNENFWKEVFNP